MSRARIPYTSRDYTSIREDLLARIPQCTDRWTDFNSSDLGIVLLEMLCGIGDMLAYTLDAQANECFMETAIQRESVMNLAWLVGYRPHHAVAATTTLRFFMAQPASVAIPIPAGTRAYAELADGRVAFETRQAVTLHAGATCVDAAAWQGTAQEETFEADGAAYQSFVLATEGAAEGSLEVLVDGEPWIQVDHFQASGAGDRHTTAELDFMNQSIIRFGEGQRGAIPQNGAEVKVQFLKSLGAAGNLGPGLVTKLEVPLGALSVTNIDPASGGTAPELTDHIRRQAPAELASLWKAVTPADYIALSQGFPGVMKATVLEAGNCPHMPYLRIIVVTVPEGGGVPSAPLLSDLYAYLDARRVITVTHEVRAAAYVSFDVEAQVTLYPGTDPQSVRTAILKAIEDAYALKNVAFGQGIHRSDLIALIDRVEGVHYLSLTRPAKDLDVLAAQIPVPGNILLNIQEAR